MEVITPDGGVPIYSWVVNPEQGAIDQIIDVSRLPVIFHHVAWMPDGHMGYGMPIGGVATLENAISPNLVGKDISCGVFAVKTTFKTEDLTRDTIIAIRRLIKKAVPTGEANVHKDEQEWDGFDTYMKDHCMTETPGWWAPNTWKWAKRSLGTLGGGR